MQLAKTIFVSYTANGKHFQPKFTSTHTHFII